MRGRWGSRRVKFDFRNFIKLYFERINLSGVKTLTYEKNDFEAADAGGDKKIEDLDYTDMGGIWGMEATTQFNKKPPSATAGSQPLNVLIMAADTYRSVLQTRVENLNNLYYNTGTTFTWDVTSSSTPTTTTSTILNYDVVVVWNNNGWGSTRDAVLLAGINNGIGVVKCHFYTTDISGTSADLSTSISPMSDGAGNSSSYIFKNVSEANDPIMFANCTAFAHYYKSADFFGRTLYPGAVRYSDVIAYRETSNNRVVQFNAFPSEGGNSYNSNTYANWGGDFGTCRVFLNAIYWAGSRV